MNLSGEVRTSPHFDVILAFTTLQQCFSFIRLLDRHLPTSLWTFPQRSRPWLFTTAA
ncbi:MAG: hypothetical protein ACTHJ4_08925 [Candidatus Nucleicultricaceae bacterium]